RRPDAAGVEVRPLGLRERQGEHRRDPAAHGEPGQSLRRGVARRPGEGPPQLVARRADGALRTAPPGVADVPDLALTCWYRPLFRPVEGWGGGRPGRRSGPSGSGGRRLSWSGRILNPALRAVSRGVFRVFGGNPGAWRRRMPSR